MTWNFNAMCPAGHHATQSSYDRDMLARLLNADQAIPLYCARCDTQWDATEVQRSMLGWVLNVGAP
jgi:hypothetical protein